MDSHFDTLVIASANFAARMSSTSPVLSCCPTSDSKLVETVGRTSAECGQFVHSILFPLLQDIITQRSIRKQNAIMPIPTMLWCRPLSKNSRLWVGIGYPPPPPLPYHQSRPTPETKGTQATILYTFSWKACIKPMCMSVVWPVRQLPRCHHTGQRWPIPQEEEGGGYGN